MTAPLPVDQVVRFVFTQGYEGANVLNIMHGFYDGDPPSAADLNDACEQAFNAFKDNILPTVSNDLFLQLVEGLDLSSSLANSGSFAGNEAGGDGADNLPANVSVCASLHIADHYRGGHPRMYLGGITKDRLSGVKSITGGAASDFSDAVNGFLSDFESNVMLNGTNVSPVCVRRFSAHVMLDPPQTREITGASVNTRLDSQRRRLGR